MPASQYRNRNRQGGANSYAQDVVDNFLPSLKGVVVDMTAPLHSPMQTAKGVAGMLADITKLMPGGESPDNLIAAQKFLMDRYGSLDALGRTFREDPAGVITDLGGILMGGAGLAAKAPAMVGKVGRAATPGGAWGRSLRESQNRLRDLEEIQNPSPGMLQEIEDLREGIDRAGREFRAAQGRGAAAGARPVGGRMAAPFRTLYGTPGRAQAAFQAGRMGEEQERANELARILALYGNQ